MTDQQRADTINSTYTPNLSHLANSAISGQCITQSPQCQPARCAFWTGRYPDSFKMWWNEIVFSRSEVTLANILRSYQYHTAYFGKWHLDKTINTLNNFGFNRSDSFLESDWREGKQGNFGDTKLDKSALLSKRDYLNLMKSRSWAGRLKSRAGHHDDIVAHQAVKYMSRCDKPFLCAIGFRGPHPPYASPPPYCDKYPLDTFDGHQGITNYKGDILTIDDWKLIKSQYYGSITWIDDIVGKILDFVYRNIPDTIIVFTSDHGEMLGDHGYFSKGVYAYDQVVRVPLILKIPDGFSCDYSHIIQHIDVVPTILDYLGFDIPPNIHGKSLINAFRLNKKANDFAFSAVGINPRLFMIQNQSYKTWVYGQKRFLFDLKSDPEEKINLADTKPDLVAEMLANCSSINTTHSDY